MTPDRVFMQRLKELDPRLGCEFNRDTEHFYITYAKAWGPAVPILAVVDSINGGFRQPDNRELIALQQSDLTKECMSTKLDRAEKYMYDERARIRKQRREGFRDRTKDDKLQLMRALSGRTKANRPFRQVTPVAKGKVF